jgi:hypothetical protein
VKPMHDESNEHGTKNMKFLPEWIYEEFDEYRTHGYEFSEIKTILPLLKTKSVN